MPERLLVTGASGRIGRALRPRLAREGRVLRLLDVAAPDPPTTGEAVEVLTGSVTDLDVLGSACADVDAVVHLGGISGEAPWAEILDINVHGTQQVLDAARRAGVRRVVLASSNHAVGCTPIPQDAAVPADAPPRPDTYYGVSKVAMEALGALYADRHGLDVSSLRIGTCAERPRCTRDLATWLSFDDCARLVEACLATSGPPRHRVLWGVSANSRGFTSLAEGAEIGYRPLDDAEAFAGEVTGGVEPLVGGWFTRFPLGERP